MVEAGNGWIYNTGPPTEGPGWTNALLRLSNVNGPIWQPLRQKKRQPEITFWADQSQPLLSTSTWRVVRIFWRCTSGYGVGVHVDVGFRLNLQPVIDLKALWILPGRLKQKFLILVLIVSINQRKLYPSIHFLYPLNPSVGSRGAGAYPSGHRARGGVHPGQVASPSQGDTETNNQTRSHSLLRKKFYETPINRTCMFLDGGRKPEYLERTHAYTRRTCKLHTERPQQGAKKTLSFLS